MHSTQFIENLLDGYGFAMALAMHLESHSLFFPNSEKRQALVRGFGRSITYFPCSENRAEKYRDYFNYMALYPSDLESFYKGVGFSLGFSQSLKKEDERLEEFKTDEKFHLLQGLQEAEIALTKMASTR